MCLVIGIVPRLDYQIPGRKNVQIIIKDFSFILFYNKQVKHCIHQTITIPGKGNQVISILSVLLRTNESVIYITVQNNANVRTNICSFKREKQIGNDNNLVREKGH